MLKTRQANPDKPVRVMVYGVEGVGKSTLGAKSDKPIFISPEGGTDQLRDVNGVPVTEMENVTDWDSLKNAIHSLLTEKHDFKTLVIDSADWVESLAHAKIIGNSGKSIITCNGGYGAGYRQSQNMHKALIEDLALLREKNGMNIIVTAHAHVKDVKDPGSMEDYQAFEIKCHEFVSSLWREWVDGLFFVRFHTVTQTPDGTTKARAMSDGRRILYTVKQPAFQAKNRYGLPPEFNFTEKFWDEFKLYTSSDRAKEATNLLGEIQQLATLVTDEKQKLAVKEAISKAGTDLNKLKPIHKRLVEITTKKECA